MKALLPLLLFSALALAIAEEVGPKVDLKTGFIKGLGAIKAKYAKPAPSHGIPFPKIRGPKSKSARIGVVGAGPGGTHMAWLLKRAGYKDVTILEKTDRVGGKSEVYNYRGVAQFVSTILVQPAYA